MHALLQGTCPAVLQACTQFVPSHVTVPPVGAAHIVQLEPHALVSFATQAPLHRCCPLVHWHELLTQCDPPVHAVLQLLQWLSSLVRSTHALPHDV